MMEIEVKAKVTDPESLGKKLTSLGGAGQDYLKKDLYFTHSVLQKPSGSPSFFRIRQENDTWYITGKIRRMDQGMEINTEREFQVSDPGQFRLLMEDMGFHPYVEKIKEGKCYTSGRIKAELSLVHRLGHYLELEILLEDGAGEGDINLAKKEIYDFMDKLEIPKEDVVTTSYTRMLLELDMIRPDL